LPEVPENGQFIQEKECIILRCDEGSDDPSVKTG